MRLPEPLAGDGALPNWHASRAGDRLPIPMTRPATLLRSTIVRVLLPVLGIVSLAGCKRHVLAAGVSDSTFVSAMASLRRLPARYMVDSASRLRARDSILTHYGLTVAKLEAAAAAVAASPTRAGALWAEISKKENAPRDVDRVMPKRADTNLPVPKAAVPK